MTRAPFRDHSPVRAAEVMTAETCARLILKLLSPGLVDRIARRAIEQGK